MRPYGVFHEKFGLILFLVVALVSVGQLTNTIYVPAMSLIAHSMHIHPERVETLIGIYLLAYGFSQYFYGPISDLVGRRPVILVGLVIFAVGSSLAILATQFPMLFWGCLVQGLGTGVCGVMARTVMRDCYSDQKLQKANSYVSIALILAPLLAPIIGGLLSVKFGWRADFIFLFIFGTFILGMEYYLFPETNIYVKEKYRDFARIKHAYKVVFSHRQFWGYALSLVLAFGGIAVFEASAGVLFTRVLGYPVKAVSWLFVIPIPGYLLGSYAAAYLSEWMPIQRLMKLAILAVAISAFVFCFFAFQKIINIYVVLLPITLFFFSGGLLFPTATTGALNPLGEYAGTAGAVLGGTQNLGAAILTLFFSAMPQTTQRPLGVMLLAVTLGLVAVFLTLLKPAVTPSNKPASAT